MTLFQRRYKVRRISPNGCMLTEIIDRKAGTSSRIVGWLAERDAITILGEIRGIIKDTCNEAH